MRKRFRGMSSAICLAALLLLSGCGVFHNADTNDVSAAASAKGGTASGSSEDAYAVDLDEIPVFDGEPYVELNDNEPCFTEEEKEQGVFEEYSDLDELGRCGTAYANICEELMPIEKRGAIGFIRPSGWHTVKYDFIDGKYLYNRCHLIAFRLAGENANEENLVTGTRYMNVDGMIPFENLVADYVEETDHHVLYRVTPVYDGDDLVATGLEMEGLSLEDNGEGVSFHVFVYNYQPGVAIDYATGDSELSDKKEIAAYEEWKDDASHTVRNGMSGNGNTGASGGEGTGGTSTRTGDTDVTVSYILNQNTGKFHLPDCESVRQMSEKNKVEYDGSRQSLIEQGYVPCQRCRP